MKRKVLSVLLSLALIFTSADFTVLATEQTTEIESVARESISQEKLCVQKESGDLEEIESSGIIVKESLENNVNAQKEDNKSSVANEEENHNEESVVEQSEKENASSEDDSKTNITKSYYDEIMETESKVIETESKNINDVNDLTLDETINGQCGDNLTWVLENGTLTISGTGKMFSWGWATEDPPWESYKSYIKKIIICDGVTNIGDNAFCGCSELTEPLILPDSITAIDTAAFKDCVNLTGALILPDNLTRIGASAFNGCRGLTGKLTIPNKIAAIEGYAFSGCSSFTGNLVIPNGVPYIGQGAFSDCSGFTGNLVIPDSVTNIEENAFNGCSGFTGNLIIPDSVTRIGQGAFSDCSGFTGNLIIPEGIRYIESHVFSNCRGFTGNLIISNDAIQIKYGAFSGCCGFTGNLVIPDNVTNIGEYAFSDCSGFTGNLVIPDGVTNIGKYAFNNCNGLTEKLIIPNNVTNIGEHVFSGCSGFTGNLVISDNVTNIGKYAFSDCSGFTGDLVVPDSVTSIGNGAFSGCNGFTGNLVISNSITNIEGGVFSGCSGFTGNLVIPNNVTSIGNGAFSDCSGFTGNLIISKSVINIGQNAFSNCSGFNGNLIISDGVEKINMYAFEGCNGFTGDLIIPNSVTFIGICAFSNCSGFNGNLIISDGLGAIPDYAFGGCNSLTGNLIIPNNITAIGQCAFSDCSGLTGDLIIPDSITSVKQYAFRDCSGFGRKLVFGSNVKFIDQHAFANCGGISQIIFKGNLPTETYSSSLSSDIFENIIAKIYYPNYIDSWKNRPNLVGNFTWISYSEGQRPWEMDSSETAPQIWASFNINPSDISYNTETGYSVKEFNLNINAIYMHVDTEINSNYENVKMTLELPKGLSLSKDKEIITTTSVFGTMDSDNGKWDSSYSLYITTDEYVDEFPVNVTITADSCETPQIYTFDIEITKIKVNHIKSLLPENGYQFCDLALIYCEIEFDQNIEDIKEDNYVYLVEYNNPENVIEKFTFKQGEESFRIAPWVLGETNKLVFKFNSDWKTKGTLLSADTQYSILIDNQSIKLEGMNAYFDISDKDCWSFKTWSLEHPLIKNMEAATKIDLSIYEKFYKPLTARLIRNATDGTKGLCFGFSYATGAWNEGCKTVKSIGTNAESLKDFKLTTKGKLTYTFHEYIQFAHIYQKSSVMKKVLDNNKNKYEELYGAVKNYENKQGNPIIFCAMNKANSGHAVVPTGILFEDQNSVVIATYDCNGSLISGLEQEFITELVLEKKDGKFINWSFPGNGDDKYNADNGNFTFYEIDSSLDNIIGIIDSENQNNNFVESSNLIFTKTEINNLDGIIFLADDIAFNDENFKYLYWTDDKKVFRKANDSFEYSELGITNGDKEISANMPLNSDITLDLNDNSVKADLKNTSDYSITYCSVEENESIKSTVISGNTFGEILLQQTEDGIIVAADSLLEVKVSTENRDNINEVTFTSSQNSILIKDDDDIRIYEDGDNDGTYEKEIASSNENMEKLSLPESNYESGSSVRQGTLITLLSEENAVIYYTVDGTIPTIDSLIYSEPIVVNTDITIQAIAIKEGYKNSDIATFVYTLAQEQYYTVTFNSNGGTDIVTQTVQENGKAIEPTAPTKEGYTFTGWYLNGVLYNFDTEVISDIVLEAGWTEDGKAATPTPSIASGSIVASGTRLRLISSEGAKIYYTLDETVPTVSSTLFTEDILITQHTIIKAFAVQEGLKDSDIATFIYDISASDNPNDLGDVLPEDIPESGIPNGLWIAGIKDVIYTGKAIKPSVRVYDYKTRLTEKRDYTISYKNNINVNDTSNINKDPSVIITAKGNYSGKETATFKILAKDINSTGFGIADIAANPNKKVQKLVPVVTFNGKKLSNKKDFTITYPDTSVDAYKEKGTYAIKIAGKGNYTGEKTIKFIITDNNLITKAKVSKISDRQYTGKALTPDVQVKYGKAVLNEGTDYELEYQNNTEIGTANVIIKGKGGYSGQKTVSFKITGAAINKGKVTGLDTPSIFNGNEITKNFNLVVTVDGSQRTLKAGQDYTITYQNNKNVGKATVILTGINGYSGTLKKTFKINAYDLRADTNKKVSYSKSLSVPYAKNGSCPDPVIYFGETKLEKGRDYSLSYKNNKAVNSGINSATAPMVIVKGKGNFIGTLPISFVITSQNMSSLTLTANDKEYKNRANIFATSITVTDINGKVLSAGKDYDKNSIAYTYANNVKLENGMSKKAGDSVEKADIIPVGTKIQVAVTAKAGGCYTGTVKGTYRIIKSDIKKAKVSIPAQTYTGKAIIPEKSDINVTVGGTKLTESEFEIVSCSNNIKKGNASITIKGKGNYGGTKTVKFTIKSKGFLWWWRK